MPDTELVVLLALIASFLVIVVTAFNNYRMRTKIERFREHYNREKRGE